MGILQKILQEEGITADDKNIEVIIDRRKDRIKLNLNNIESELEILRSEKKIINKNLNSKINNATQNIELLKVQKQNFDKELEIERLRLSKHKTIEEINELESIKKILLCQNKVSEMKKKINEHIHSNIDLISKIQSDKDGVAEEKLNQLKKDIEK